MRAANWIALAVGLVAALLLDNVGLSTPLAVAFGSIAGVLAYLAGRARVAGVRAEPVQTATTQATPQIDKTVADLFQQPVITLDGQLLVHEFSPRAKELYPALERGRTIALAVRDPDVLDIFERALTADGELTAFLNERGGAERLWRVRVRRVSRGDRPREARIVALLEDLSEQRALERLRVDFVANASHELRTPLASLLGYIETLQGPARNDAAARERFLGIMREQAARMARLIDDLLSLSRAELRAHQPLLGEADLGLAVREIIESLRLSARERGVAITLDAPTGPVMLRADRDDLLRLSENLIENAVKYGRDGGKVDVAITINEDGVTLAVRDHGPGIALEHIPRLTERFYRVDASHSRETGGTGLGLAIVKHIAARHGARLAIVSRPGEGATFTVTFPLLHSVA